MDLKEAFQKHQVDGYLNRERFNETILSILKFDIPVISYTYLSERLFDLLDDSSDGRIQEEEFIAGMRNVFSTREVREKCKIVMKL
jgi:Ca2+-binding EF-hand superfamily protein